MFSKKFPNRLCSRLLAFIILLCMALPSPDALGTEIETPGDEQTSVSENDWGEEPARDTALPGNEAPSENTLSQEESSAPLAESFSPQPADITMPPESLPPQQTDTATPPESLSSAPESGTPSPEDTPSGREDAPPPEISPSRDEESAARGQSASNDSAFLLDTRPPLGEVQYVTVTYMIYDQALSAWQPYGAPVQVVKGTRPDLAAPSVGNAGDFMGWYPFEADGESL